MGSGRYIDLNKTTHSFVDADHRHRLEDVLAKCQKTPEAEISGITAFREAVSAALAGSGIPFHTFDSLKDRALKLKLDFIVYS